MSEESKKALNASVAPEEFDWEAFENDGQVGSKEETMAKYEQTLILPDDVDKNKIEAKVEDGILTVNLPKVEEAKVKVARSIEIQ